MYKVIVIDDEYWSLKSILNTFPWEEFGFCVAASGTNPMQLTKLIEEHKPDAVFSDVCMPVIDGFELLKQTKTMGNPPQFVFISGFDDYQYIRQAVVNHAFDYCLKPIDFEEARNVLIRLKAYLDESRGALGSEEGLKHIENREFKQMIEYINLHYTERMYLQDLAKQFFLNKNYCCLLFNKYFHMSFSRYLNLLRVEKAAELLSEDKTLSIDEISERAGYSNYCHFIKVFKAIKGVSPSQYRKNH